jgi:uncharacterized lipoprotein YddW (UPF0748 family)
MKYYIFTPISKGYTEQKIKADSLEKAVKKLELGDWKVYKITHICDRIENLTLKDIKKGSYFTTSYIECPKETQVLIKGEYDRSSKSFSCYKFSDTNCERFLKADKEVYTDFTF